jgi:hypothetical protein
VVESTALEMRHTGNRIGGSNPSLSANFMSMVVCPSPPMSTETPVLKGSLLHHRLCLADHVCYHLPRGDGHGDGQLERDT